jgi:hypothetical protein
VETGHRSLRTLDFRLIGKGHSLESLTRLANAANAGHSPSDIARRRNATKWQNRAAMARPGRSLREGRRVADKTTLEAVRRTLTKRGLRLEKCRLVVVDDFGTPRYGLTLDEVAYEPPTKPLPPGAWHKRRQVTTCRGQYRAGEVVRGHGSVHFSCK